MMITEEDLKTTVGSRIAALVIGAAFAALGIVIKMGIVDISMLVEAWSHNRMLGVFTVWWSYVGVGVMLIIAGVLPSSYKSARLYTDKIELIKKETKAYSFDNIFDVSTNKHMVLITFKDGTAQVRFTCRKKSIFPQAVVKQFKEWKK